MATQQLHEKLMKISKDPKAAILAIDRAMAALNTKERKHFEENVDSIIKCMEPTPKREKQATEKIICKIKENIKRAFGSDSTKIIKYQQTTELQIDEIDNLDLIKDKDKLAAIFSRIDLNENCGYVIPLYEAYRKGQGYRKVKKRFEDQDAYYKYCKECLGYSKATVYRYLQFYELTQDFPCILLCGFGFTIVSKHVMMIRNAAQLDKELHALLSTSFPGIEAKVSIDDPTLNIGGLDITDNNE